MGDVAIPFVIGAIFGPGSRSRLVLFMHGRNPLCDRGYLRTDVSMGYYTTLHCRNPLCDRGYLRTNFSGGLPEEGELSQSPL